MNKFRTATGSGCSTELLHASHRISPATAVWAFYEIRLDVYGNFDK